MSLVARLESLELAVAAARTMGLEASAAKAAQVLELARRRTGYPGGTYVLALAGGTGVGKSSVLNALAGETVSPARAVRPTTDHPVAWVADERRGELGPLLEWLDIGTVVTHRDGDLGHLALLDLPDMDSMRTEHRQQVDALLPRIDAVAWVVDPEKYDDERLYEYLRDLARHAPRMRFILNKSDRLRGGTLEEVADDLRRRLAAAGIRPLAVDVLSATTGHGIAELRSELRAAADAKAVIDGKLSADAAAAVASLASAAGVTAGRDVPLVGPERRAATIRAAQEAAIALIDPAGLRQQARGAVLGRARRSGGGLLGRTVGWIGKLSGRETRRADPAIYLRHWRRRGTLARAVNPVRAALTDAVRGVPPEGRQALLRSLTADRLEEAIGAAIDGAVEEQALAAEPPGSWLWPVIGVLQLAAAAVLLFAIAWYATIVLAGGLPVTTAELPWLGQVPLPLVLLAGSLAVSVVLGWLLTLHAAWVGGRFARRVVDRVRARVSAAVAATAFARLDEVEAARARLAQAARTAAAPEVR